MWYSFPNIYFQALELKPDDQQCLVTRSKCHLMVGNPDAALADAEAALDQDKQNPIPWVRLLNHINSED